MENRFKCRWLNPRLLIDCPLPPPPRQPGAAAGGLGQDAAGEGLSGIEMLLLFEHLCRRAVIDRVDVEGDLAVAITSALFEVC